MTHNTLSLAAACLLIAIPAAATGQPAARQPKAKPPAATPGQPTAPATPPPPGPLVEWAEEMFKLPSVGLTMHMPVGATSQQIQMGKEITVQIMPADKSWIINIRTPVTSNPAATVQEALDQTIALIQGQVGVLDKDQKTVLSTQAKILDRADRLEIPGLPPAARAYLQVPRQDGTPVVKGYTFFKTTPTQYVLFELLAPDAGYQRARTIYETTVATAAFADQIEVVAARGSAIKSGVAFFQQLQPADYLAAMGKDTAWFRLYTPASSGAPSDATEHGYRGLRFWQGKRGEINPDTPRSRWKDAENADGYLAELSVRLLQDGNIFDSRARYFMTPDRNEEAWSVRMVQRDKSGKEMGRWTETGARAGTEVTVVVQEPGKKPEPVVPIIQGEGYISQLESYLLPALLSAAAVKNSLEGEFAFYTYSSSSTTIAIRTDTISRDANSGGVVSISTRFRDEPAQKSLFNDRGDLIRTQLPDNRIWEPTDLQKLDTLWRSKGLPTARPKD